MLRYYCCLCTVHRLPNPVLQPSFDVKKLRFSTVLYVQQFPPGSKQEVRHPVLNTIKDYLDSMSCVTANWHPNRSQERAFRERERTTEPRREQSDLTKPRSNPSLNTTHTNKRTTNKTRKTSISFYHTSTQRDSQNELYIVTPRRRSTRPTRGSRRGPSPS
jgi:hypothetical protein